MSVALHGSQSSANTTGLPTHLSTSLVSNVTVSVLADISVFRDWRELEVELIQSAQDECVGILEATRPLGPVLVVRDADVLDAIQQALGADARFRTSQRRTCTAVDARGKR